MKNLILSNKDRSNRLQVLYCVTVFAIAAAGLWFAAGSKTVDANPKGDGDSVAPAATFAGANLGAIPDNLPATPRDVTFAVSGITGAPTNVEVSLTLLPIHSWVGDLNVFLIAPNGASHVVFGRTGQTGASAGDSSDVSGPYNFKDSAAGTNWWTAANTAGAAAVVPPGDYRTTQTGPQPVITTSPVTVMTAAFAGIPTSNGTWTLRFTDNAAGDTGSVSAATLTVEGAVAAPDDAPVDMNGDGLTDFVIVRNTGGGPGGQITWMTQLNGPGTVSGAQWGLQGDEFVPADYDGDDKDDISVWRGAPGTGSTWFVLNSATQTARVEQFGISTDDPSLVDDYDGDNKADLAVYRSGASSGDPSFWYYRTTAGGPVTTIAWGQNGDFPVPGDFNGDGKGDFVVQRNAGGGQARFFVGFNAGGTLPPTVQPSFIFGTPTDVILPGDYDGDDKTDICVVRGISGNINWFYHPSDGSADVLYQIFGNSATDFPVQGDYDGDGRIDLAVWRPNIDPTQTFFFWRRSTNGVITQSEWGQNGDYPVANYNNH